MTGFTTRRGTGPERRSRKRGLVTSVALAVVVTTVAPAAAAPPTAPAPAAARHTAAFTGAEPCPGLDGYTCATLTVPLDHSGTTPGALGLRVAMSGNTDAPLGDLVLLTGGPGQPGVPFVKRMASVLGPVLGRYRLVMIDQRGTGASALRCPRLQSEMGSSDLTPPTPEAVTECAAALGPDRRFYSTADTVADLDMLREALGARRLTLDGVSYGTFVAERYALAHPQRVARLVLDSVVPQRGYDPLDLAALRATPRILAAACRAAGCATDPARDLAAVIRRYHNGPAVLDMLTTYEFVDPDYGGVPEALHAAAEGRPQMLQAYMDGTREGGAASAEELSQGLHASTLCADGHYPWGTSDTPVEERAAALDRTRENLSPRQVWPYDAATATGLGSLLTCLAWPREPVPPSPPDQRRLPVPALLLGGDRDLSTPLEWLYAQAAVTPRAQVVVVPGAAHSVQSRAANDAGRRAVYDFLLHP